MRTIQMMGASGGNRRGNAIVVIIILIVIGVFLWLDPMALFHRSGSGMPWDEERRIARQGVEIKQPKEEQPKISDNMVFLCPIEEDKDVVGEVLLFILPDGHIRGEWSGKYKPEPDLLWEIVGSRFKGNIDPTKLYSDAGGEDPKKLYFIAKGGFLILETNSKTDKIRTASGDIYVTGWLDNEYNAVGRLTVTSDKKTYWEYDWQGKGKKTEMVPDFKVSLPVVP
ncbi:MAG: hypothetical protein JW947_04115 [Sedimentisphaerales bacterium]|nr:hypothetical protein [Sedimentisphaerales bacterium]